MLGEGINPLDILFTQEGNNLSLDIFNTQDSASIENWHLNSNYQIEVIQAGDGSNLLNSQVNQLIQAMATFCTDNGTTWEQAIQDRPDDVQAILAAHWQPAA